MKIAPFFICYQVGILKIECLSEYLLVLIVDY